MNENWRGLIRIEEIKHLDQNGDIIWSAKDLHNMLHIDGEYYVLNKAFRNQDVGTWFACGLDNRTELDIYHTMDHIVGEPEYGGYARTWYNPNTFTLEFRSTHWVAVSPVQSFSATDTWPPVRNMFLHTGDILISTVPLDKTVTLEADQSITAKFVINLRHCPPGG